MNICRNGLRTLLAVQELLVESSRRRAELSLVRGNTCVHVRINAPVTNIDTDLPQEDAIRADVSAAFSTIVMRIWSRAGC